MSNAKLKFVQKLHQKKYRTQEKLFLAEGLRLCEMALKFSCVEFGFYTEEFLKDMRAKNLVAELEKISTMYKISTAEFSKISETETPQGILLVVKQNLKSAEEVLQKNFVVVLDDVQDPGNVGTILRTAEAFDCGIILLEGSADIFNSKVVRSSMGAVFSASAVNMTRKNFSNLMREKNFEIVSTALDNTAEIYFNHEFKNKTAIVFGNEGEGVSAEILNASKKIFIPMFGTAESLNVATAAAIIISEAVRQKNF